VILILRLIYQMVRLNFIIVSVKLLVIVIIDFKCYPSTLIFTSTLKSQPLKSRDKVYRHGQTIDRKSLLTLIV